MLPAFPLMRYHLHQHPAFPGLLTKEDLYVLVERGSLARGDLCTDTVTDRDHTVGEIITGMRPPRASAPARINRPAYQEFRADSPLDDPQESDANEEAEDEDDDGSLEGEIPSSTEEETEAEDDMTGVAWSSSGELILYQAHPSWLGYPKALFLTLLLLAATAMLFEVAAEYAIVTGLCALATLICVAIDRSTHDYHVTEERVEINWGLLGRSSKEVRICDIRSIDVHERGLKGLIGLGRVDFSSSANAGIEVQFTDIRGAHKVKQLVRKLQRGNSAG